MVHFCIEFAGPIFLEKLLHVFVAKIESSNVNDQSHCDAKSMILENACSLHSC